MKLNGPVVTLAAGAALAAGLLGANLVFTGRDGAATAGAGLASAVSSSNAATEAPSSAAAGPPSSGAAGSSSFVVSGPSSVAAPGTTATSSAVAPPSTAAPPATGTATYAGTVTKGGPLAVAVKGTSAVAYLCDGTTEAWLWGTADGAGVSLKNPTGASLTAASAGGRLVGTISVKGRQWSFTLPTVAKPSGLYRSTAQIRGATVVSGWVVLPDGRQVGMSTSQDGDSRRADPLDPQTGQANVSGVVVTATPPVPGEPHV
jgi:hypothetical protein